MIRVSVHYNTFFLHETGEKVGSHWNSRFYGAHGAQHLVDGSVDGPPEATTTERIASITREFFKTPYYHRMQAPDLGETL